MTEIVTPRLPSLHYVDALLGSGPHWNFLPAHDNTIRYTFAPSSANGDHVADALAFTPTQQANTRAAFEYISALTGIRFVETADAAAAQVHLACADILEAEVAGVCISAYSYTEGAATSDYSASSYVYIDNKEWYDYAGALVPGTQGYELLLHELGHMLGLKHPFETEDGNPSTLSNWLDNTAHTLMSYTSQGGPYSAYGQFDVAALMWLYGGDGLGGKLGVGGAGGYWMGSSDNDWLSGDATDDVLQGAGGDDVIIGGGGADTVVFQGTRDSYDIVAGDPAEATVKDLAGGEGTDTVRWVELFQFADGIFTFAQVTNADVTPPAAPVVGIEHASGKITISGTAEPNARVEVFYSLPHMDHLSFGSAQADATGLWSLEPRFFDNNSYVFYASATDASGNVSNFSAQQAVLVDAVIPATPTMLVEQDGSYLIGGTRPVLYGTAHPGSTVNVYVDNAVAATSVAGTDGHWQALGAEVGAGTHLAYVVATAPDGRVLQNWELSRIRVDLAAGFAGTDAGDSFGARDGDNTYGGGAGVDSLVYAGPSAAYAVTVGARGVTVRDTQGGGGTDTLFSVERLQFGDAHIAVDLDGAGGQAYRLYNAVLGRAPDEAGLGFWMSNMDKGVSLRAVAGDMMTSAEFIANFGANLSNQQLVQTLYQNILERAPEQAGLDYWVNALNDGKISQPDALAFISESSENRSSVDPAIANGFMYTPWA